ncbi:hypothetical protein UY3_07618 [Chelonia mydas]|uniref:Uncharacterized protein n=1 Tax=Chelonia mydas TaxID=8469 RepID=M7BT24_CHEMY|nr:hypothetical protein UY3_07618 [Chelonia mydas]
MYHERDNIGSLSCCISLLNSKVRQTAQCNPVSSNQDLLKKPAAFAVQHFSKFTAAALLQYEISQNFSGLRSLENEIQLRGFLSLSPPPPKEQRDGLKHRWMLRVADLTGHQNSMGNILDRPQVAIAEPFCSACRVFQSLWASCTLPIWHLDDGREASACLIQVPVLELAPQQQQQGAAALAFPLPTQVGPGAPLS